MGQGRRGTRRAQEGGECSDSSSHINHYAEEIAHQISTTNSLYTRHHNITQNTILNLFTLHRKIGEIKVRHKCEKQLKLCCQLSVVIQRCSIKYHYHINVKTTSQVDDGFVNGLLTADTLGHFTFWISLSLKTETKRFKFGLGPKFGLTNHRITHHCSLHNVTAVVIADISVFLCLLMNQRKSEVIFVHQNLISNRLTYRCMQNQRVS